MVRELGLSTPRSRTRLHALPTLRACAAARLPPPPPHTHTNPRPAGSGGARRLTEGEVVGDPCAAGHKQARPEAGEGGLVDRASLWHEAGGRGRCWVSGAGGGGSGRSKGHSKTGARPRAAAGAPPDSVGEPRAEAASPHAGGPPRPHKARTQAGSACAGRGLKALGAFENEPQHTPRTCLCWTWVLMSTASSRSAFHTCAMGGPASGVQGRGGRRGPWAFGCASGHRPSDHTHPRMRRPVARGLCRERCARPAPTRHPAI